MRKFIVIFLSLILFSVLVACASGGPTTNLRVNMTDFVFEPREYTVPAGESITLVLSNNGALEHSFLILKLGTEIDDGFNPDDHENIYWEAELVAGAQESFSFTAPTEPGEYYIVCDIEGHIESGMVGTLKVVASN